MNRARRRVARSTGRIVSAICLCLWFSLSLTPHADSAAGVLEGAAVDPSGARLPGVTVELLPATGAAQSAGPRARPVATTTTDPDGRFRLDRLASGEYWVRFTLSGFGEVRERVTVGAGGVAEVSATLRLEQLSERVDVAASDLRIDTERATQSTSFSREVLTQLPTPSRNYTHVIVAEAGVNAPLPDRTGKGMNLATEPGAQADDAGQSLNPSVNGARPTNNSLSLNGVDTTNLLSTAGGLGSNIGIPLEALEEVDVQTAQTSASQGRNGGGSIQLVTRAGTDRFSGSGSYAFQHERLNANEFFLNRAGTAKPEFRRNDASGTLGGPLRSGRTYFFGAAQRQDFRSGYASNAIARTGLPIGLTDNRTAETIAQVANEWLRSGAADNPAFAGNFLNALRAFPAEQQAGLISQFFSDPGSLVFRELTPADIHPVALNILNVQRDGRYLIPSPREDMPVLPGTTSNGREYLAQQVIPTSFEGITGFLSLQHRIGSSNQTRVSLARSTQNVEEAFGWADASPSPTLGQTPAWLAGVTNTHTFGSRLLQEVSVGYFDLQNTRISLNRDLFNSSLGINNPLEGAIGGLAALMPTIDINTQRNSGGIGNAWDFFDIQRVFHTSGRWSLVAGSHTWQGGVEYRRIGFEGEYMSRTNGDLDYDNWVFFFTGHGASGGGSDLDQGDTRRSFRTQDVGVFLQDDWRIGGGLTVNAGLRYDIIGNLSERNGRIGNYYLPEVAAQLGAQPGFQVPANSPFFQPGFTPLDIGLYVVPGTPVSLDQIHVAPYDSTLRGDYNNVSPRLGFAWQPTFARKFVLRGGWGVYYERPSAGFKVDLQRAAPFFIYQNVPAPPDMANPYPQLNVNPFQIPLNVTVARDANGAARWLRADGTSFPASSPFNAKSNTFFDPLVETPYSQQWTANVQYEASNKLLFDVRYVGSRGVGLLGKINLAHPLDPRVTRVNGFTDIYDAQGRLINPDFFVPPELLGLSRSGGFQQLTNIGRSTYHALQTNVRGRVGRRGQFTVGYTWGKSLDTLSSDRSLVEHDPLRPENNYGPSDYDRTHRLTTAFMVDLPGAGRGLLRAATGGWQLSGFMTYQSGTPFSVTGASTRNAFFAQVGRARVSFAPGRTIDDATLSGPVQDRLDRYFDPTAFQDSLDAWGDTGRNILRGPSQAQLDLSLARHFRPFDRHRLELRWEAYNVTNTPVFSNPASAFAANGYGTAGVIASTIGGPRTMQLAARYSF